MLRRKLSVALLSLAAVVPLPAQAQEPYDLLIRNGRVLDGTGTPKGNVPCQTRDGGTVFTIGAQYGTLWYLITRP